MDFDISKLTPEQITALAGKLGPAIKQTITEGVVSAVTDQLKQSLGAELTKQVTESVQTQVTEAMKTARSKGGDPTPDADKGKKEGEEPPAWFKPYMDGIKKITDAQDAAATKQQQEAAAAAALKLATETLKAKRPNMKPEQLNVVASDIAARGPKDEAGVLATLNELVEKNYKPMGFDIKPLLADASAEGAKPVDADPKKAAEQKKLEELKSTQSGW